MIDRYSVEGTAQERARFRALPKGFRRLPLRILLYYALICGAVYFVQKKLLYFPGHQPLDRTIEAAGGHGLTMWPAADEAYHGFVREPERPPAKGTVLVFHGNAGTAQDRGFYADALCPLGYRVLLIEYPGYGSRGGDVGEKPFVSAARESVELAGKQFGLPLFVMGESLGAAVGAAGAAQADIQVAGAAAITPWHNLPDLAQSIYWYLPAKWLARDQYDNAENLNALDARVAVCIAGDDSIIPPFHGERLFDDLTGRKRKWVFPGAGHNSWPIEAGEPWWSQVMNFLSGRDSDPVPSP